MSTASQDWYARRLHQRPPQVTPSVPRYQPSPDFGREVRHNTAPDLSPPPGTITVGNFIEMASRWKGGQGTKTDKHPCPECGSPRFFSRVQPNSRMPAPSPHCFDCGFNGQFSQADPSTWGATAS